MYIFLRAYELANMCLRCCVVLSCGACGEDAKTISLEDDSILFVIWHFVERVEKSCTVSVTVWHMNCKKVWNCCNNV